MLLIQPPALKAHVQSLGKCKILHDGTSLVALLERPASRRRRADDGDEEAKDGEEIDADADAEAEDLEEIIGEPGQDGGAESHDEL